MSEKQKSESANNLPPPIQQYLDRKTDEELRIELERKLVSLEVMNANLRDEFTQTKSMLLSELGHKDKLIQELESSKRSFEVNINTVEKAINECNLQLAQHRSRSFTILMIAVSVFPAMALGLNIVLKNEVISHIIQPILDKVLLSATALSVLIFGVLMAIYRFYLNEISKIESHKIGFMRISIAANNSPEGYGTDVRKSLTSNPFENSSNKKKNDKIESPLPGHPSTDVATLLLNKVLDGIDLVAKKKPE